MVYDACEFRKYATIKNEGHVCKKEKHFNSEVGNVGQDLIVQL